MTGLGKSFCVCQFLRGRVDGEKRGYESLRDAQLWRSPLAVACEPILPTKALMPAGRHEVDEEEAWPLAGFESGEAPPHSVGGSRAVQARRSARPATSTRAASLPERRAFAQPRRVQARDGGPDFRGAPDRLWPLMPGTAPAGNTADSRSGRKGETARSRESMLLTHFTQPQAGPRWTAQPPVFAASMKASAPQRPVARPNAAAHCHGPYSSGGSSTGKSTGGASLGGAHSIWRSSASCIVCLKSRGAGSTPIDRQFATVLAHTR